MHVLEKCTGDNLTSWIQFSFYRFIFLLSFVKLGRISGPHEWPADRAGQAARDQAGQVG